MRIFYKPETSNTELFESDQFQLAAFSARSPFKERVNEDCAGWNIQDQNSSVFLVADGLGGMPLGNIASYITAESVLSRVALKEQRESLNAALFDGIDEANKTILGETTKSGATMSAVLLQNNIIRPYLVGDCSVIVIGGRGLVKYQSRPHSPVGYLKAAGILTERQALEHGQSHLVSNVLGSEDMFIEVGPCISINPKDTVLLASDGLTDNIPVEQIADIICGDSLESATQTLASNCLLKMQQTGSIQQGKADDLTLLAFRLHGA